MRRPNFQETHYINGKPSVDWMATLEDLFDRLEAAESKLTAIAAVTAPSGGSTIDAEARTAINDIISGAG